MGPPASCFRMFKHRWLMAKPWGRWESLRTSHGTNPWHQPMAQGDASLESLVAHSAMRCLMFRAIWLLRTPRNSTKEWLFFIGIFRIYWYSHESQAWLPGKSHGHIKYHIILLGNPYPFEWIEWLVFMGDFRFPSSWMMRIFDILGSISPGTYHHLEAAQISYLWIQPMWSWTKVVYPPKIPVVYPYVCQTIFNKWVLLDPLGGSNRIWNHQQRSPHLKGSGGSDFDFTWKDEPQRPDEPQQPLGSPKIEE